MRIVLGAEAIQPILAGIGRYTYELAQGLIHHPEVEKIFFYAYGDYVEDPTYFFQKRYLFRRMKWMRKLPSVSLLRRISHKAGDFILRKKCTNLPVDLYHSPNFILHNINAPSVTTFHDFSFIHYPEFHPKERIKFLTQHIPKTIKLASHFITVSSFVRNELIQLFGVHPSRITVVPLGVDNSFKPRPATEIKKILNKYKLNYQSYCLTVATIEPRKNLSNLLHAYSQLPATLQNKYPLVVAGDSGWLSKDLHKKIAALERKGTLRYTGYISNEELQHLYAGARGFVYPSIYEGFGLPILEAMASGVPVLTSNISSMPEVAGGAAILINPHDSNDIARGLEKLLEDKEFYLEAYIKGIKIASQYTWENCVRNTLDIYKLILKNNS